MINVIIICEGRTERNFIKSKIAPYMAGRNIFIESVILGPPPHKGGRVNTDRFKKDLSNFLKQFRGQRYISTMFDFYKLDSGWFGMDKLVSSTDCENKVKIIETATKDYCKKSFKDFDISKLLIPYISLHEFESLLFSDASVLSQNLNCEIKYINDILSRYKSPEHINERVETAPSKQIINICPRYEREKVLMSNAISKSLTLETIRDKCKHFNDWILQLENLATLNQDF